MYLKLYHWQIESTGVAAQICADLEKKELRSALESNPYDRLKARGVLYVSWEQWQKIDEKERKLGKSRGKEREKILDF